MPVDAEAITVVIAQCLVSFADRLERQVACKAQDGAERRASFRDTLKEQAR